METKRVEKAQVGTTIKCRHCGSEHRVRAASVGLTYPQARMFNHLLDATAHPTISETLHYVKSVM